MQSEEEYIESIFGPAELDNAALVVEDDNANEPVANHEFEIEALPKENPNVPPLGYVMPTGQCN
jgi:hypothetical protein